MVCTVQGRERGAGDKLKYKAGNQARLTRHSKSQFQGCQTGGLGFSQSAQPGTCTAASQTRWCTCLCQALALGGMSQLETDAYMKHRLYLTGYQPGVGLSIKNTRRDKNRDGKWSSFLMLIPHCQRLSFTEKDQGGLGCSNSQGAVIDW